MSDKPPPTDPVSSQSSVVLTVGNTYTQNEKNLTRHFCLNGAAASAVGMAAAGGRKEASPPAWKIDDITSTSESCCRKKGTRKAGPGKTGGGAE